MIRELWGNLWVHVKGESSEPFSTENRACRRSSFTRFAKCKGGFRPLDDPPPQDLLGALADPILNRESVDSAATLASVCTDALGSDVPK
jgi:hypothetical protein